MRCEAVLAQGTRLGPDTALVFSITGLVFALPAALLPVRWPRQHAHELFSSRHERWEERATAYFGQLEEDLRTMEERAA